MRGMLFVVLLVSACGNKAPHVTGDSGVTDSTAPGDSATDGSISDALIDATADAMMGTLSPDPADPVGAPCAGRLGFPARPVVRLLNSNNAHSALELGDVSGDGKPDLVFWSGTAIEMAPGNGDGTYGTPATIGNGVGASSFTLVDVNGDAKLDIVYGDRNVTSLYVRLNNGAGGFAAATAHSVGMMGTSQIEARDVNNDGRRDLIALTGFNIVVLLNSASGFGAPTAFTTQNIGESMFFALGDISGDGKLDAVTSNLDGSVSLLVNDGAGAFGLPVIFAASGGQGGRIDVGDLDEDGKLDVVVGGVNAQVGMVSVLRNQGGSTFAGHVDYLTGSSYSPRALAIGDTNADGHLDVVAGSGGGNSDIELLLGNGNGTFTGALAMAADFPSDLVLADVNGDAKLDLITSGDASVRTYLNQATAFPFDQRRMFDYGGVQVPSARVIDVNSDNTPDLVTSLYSVNGNSVVARLGAGGSFGTVGAPLVAGFYPQSTYVSDLDNDARLDLVALGLIGGMTQIFMNNGNSTFAAQMPLATPLESRRIAVADFDGDGYRDLAVAVASSNGTVGLFHGHGNGMVSFAGNVWTGTSVMGLGYGDVDKDGDSDLLVSGGTNGVFFIDVVRSNGNGTFAQPLSISLGHAPPTRLLVRDFNVDGHPDILESGNGWLGVLLANGSGSFVPSNAQFVGSSEDAVVADLNGDGKRDVVTFDFSSASILVMIGRGDGTFDPPLYYDAGRGKRSLSVVDVNGDGRLDVVVNNSNAASILWGRCLP